MSVKGEEGFPSGVFFVLHGLVHSLCIGQGWRLFDPQVGMVWPGGSWAFSQLIRDEVTRLLASVCCALAAIGFVAGGTGILLGEAQQRPVIVVSTAAVLLSREAAQQCMHPTCAIARQIREWFQNCGLWWSEVHSANPHRRVMLIVGASSEAGCFSLGESPFG